MAMTLVTHTLCVMDSCDPGTPALCVTDGYDGQTLVTLALCVTDHYHPDYTCFVCV